MMEQLTQREMLSNDPAFYSEMRKLRDEVRLGDAWRAIMDGKGSADDARLAITDLLIETEYFGVAPDDTPDRVLQRREGKRGVMARILFLADLPSSAITKLRRDALDELQKMEV